MRSCSVAFTDARGVLHATEVLAETVLEAAALGLRCFRDQAVLDDASVFELRVEVITKTTHMVPLQRLRAWLQSSGPDPRTEAMKARCR